MKHSGTSLEKVRACLVLAAWFALAACPRVVVDPPLEPIPEEPHAVELLGRPTAPPFISRGHSETLSETRLPRLDLQAPEPAPQTAPALDAVQNVPGLVTRPLNTTCVAPNRPPPPSPVGIERAFPLIRFEAPLFLTGGPDGDNRLFLVERGGVVRVFENDDAAESSSVFIDITDRVDMAGEGGLFAMAFHPQFETNGEIFLSYTASGENGNLLTSRISRFRSPNHGISVQFAEEDEEILIQLPKAGSVHNGGMIAFGPDEYLYVSFGDGDSNDPFHPAPQAPFSLFGKVLRIDVGGPEGYAIPPDNPYSDGAEGLPEIFASGFRNPWRFSIDQETGELWLGDVGASSREEIDVVESGGNYGWNVVEGTLCVAPSCDGSDFVKPIFEYDRVGQSGSVTGGFVYRGSRMSALVGKYVFGDFATGEAWFLDVDSHSGEYTAVRIGDEGGLGINISSFGQDARGEVYALSYNTGTIHRLIPLGPPPIDTFPRQLSETGCVDPLDPSQPAAGLVTYGVRHPFWSDGAVKTRSVALPNDHAFHVEGDGTLVAPVGSVVMKTFRVGERLVETRLLVRHDDGVWAGYSYEWRDDQSDADLLPAGKVKDIGLGQTWSYPSRAACLTCHVDLASRTLALDLQQLNRSFSYPSGVTANQLLTWERIGMFDADSNLAAAPAATLPVLHGDAPLADRARAYLHANCGYCHRPGNIGGGPADLRYQTPFELQRICNVPADDRGFGIEGSLLLVPGNAALSLISQRMRHVGAGRMPPTGSDVIDEDGASVVEEWIESLNACP